MAKAELKTKKTAASVDDFIDAQKDEQVRDDCRAIIKLMSAATGEPPKMWGAAIVGFGTMKLKYESGRELDWMVCGFSPRKGNLTLYGLQMEAEHLAKLGKHTTGKGCLYIKKMADVDAKVLKAMITAVVKSKKGGKVR
jgi:hypothetical protein